MLTAYQKISKLMVYAIKHIVLNICSVNFAREEVFQFNTDQYKMLSAVSKNVNVSGQEVLNAVLVDFVCPLVKPT